MRRLPTSLNPSSVKFGSTASISGSFAAMSSAHQAAIAVHRAIPFTGEALFVLGGNSDYVGDADKAEIHRLFPSAQFTSIAGAGHWVHVEKPAEFATVVVEFLAD